MKTWDGAFGLVSIDWGGEAISYTTANNSSYPQTLYGTGLLWLWVGQIYAHVIAYREM